MTEGGGLRIGPVLFVIGAALLLGVGLVVVGGGPTEDRSAAVAWWKGEDPGCPVELEPADLDAGIELAAGWLLANQLPDGVFADGRDATTGDGVLIRDPVRQAVATWALARAHRLSPHPEWATASRRALMPRVKTTVTTAHGAVLTWPDEPAIPTEAQAILALALTERLGDPELDPDLQASLTTWRDGLLTQLEHARTGNHRIVGQLARDGTLPEGASPEAAADATTLALLARAARTDRDDLAEDAKKAWRALWLHDVDRPLKRRRDPTVVKQTFPWAPLALADLAASGWLETEDAGPHLALLARWMIDDHQTLRRSGNTAYAQVALVAAGRWAGAAEHEDAGKIQCVADRAIARLLSWQVGHPRAEGLAAAALDAPHVSGGVLAGPDDPQQRVDYASHLLVALVERREAPGWNR